MDSADDVDDLPPPNPPALLRGLRAGDDGPPSAIFVRHPATAAAAVHPFAPFAFPTARAAHAYVAAHSAGPPHLHWSVVWNSHLHQMVDRLQPYVALLALRNPPAAEG